MVWESATIRQNHDFSYQPLLSANNFIWYACIDTIFWLSTYLLFFSHRHLFYLKPLLTYLLIYFFHMCNPRKYWAFIIPVTAQILPTLFPFLSSLSSKKSWKVMSKKFRISFYCSKFEVNHKIIPLGFLWSFRVPLDFFGFLKDFWVS